MHELSVVYYVIKDVKAVAEENNIKKIDSVTLKIGEVSGVVPDYLTDFWEWARKKEPVVADAKLIIEPITAMTHCDDCGKDYETVKYAKICPHCKSENTFLLTGNEFIVKEIGVVDEDE